VLVIPSRTHDTNTAYVDFDTEAAAQKVRLLCIISLAFCACCCSVPAHASVACVCDVHARSFIRRCCSEGGSPTCCAYAAVVHCYRRPAHVHSVACVVARLQQRCYTIRVRLLYLIHGGTLIEFISHAWCVHNTCKGRVWVGMWV
jgi:hypothetical protein